jgi:hypothetical protein
MSWDQKVPWEHEAIVARLSAAKDSVCYLIDLMTFMLVPFKEIMYIFSNPDNFPNFLRANILKIV